MVREVDLNLLRALNAIIEQQSVTKAAAKLGLSQPAMSASLAKLRRHFGDALLARVGNDYEPTPLARALLEPTRTALRASERVFVRESVFDPMTTTREYSVIMSDYSTAILGPAACKRIQEGSPSSKLYIYALTTAFVNSAPEAMRTYDLIVMPHGFLTGLAHRDVFKDEWVCIVSAGNLKVGDRLTLEHLAELPWVTTYNQPNAFTTAVQQLRMQGLETRVQVVTENYMTLGALVAGSDRVALVQRRLGDLLAAAGRVRVLPTPFEVDPLVETMWWHSMYEMDPAHRWLRRTFVEAGREIS